MYVLPIALIYTFTIRQRSRWQTNLVSLRRWSKLTGLVSILLWIGGVTIPSRLIGLFT